MMICFTKEVAGWYAPARKQTPEEQCGFLTFLPQRREPGLHTCGGGGGGGRVCVHRLQGGAC